MGSRKGYFFGIILFILLSLGMLSVVSFAGVNYNLQFIEIASIIYFIVIFNNLMMKNKLFKYTNKESFMLLTLLIVFFYALIISFFSSEQMTAIQGTILILFGVIFLFLATYYIYNYENFFLIANRLFIISLFIQLIYNMYPALTSQGMSFYVLKSHSETLIGFSNAISFYFTFSFLYELISRNKRWLIYALINGISLLLTISRGAILSLVICLFIYLLISLVNKEFSKMKTLFSIFIVVLISYYLLLFTLPGQQLWQGLQFGFNASSVNSREYLVNNAIEVINSKPFGNGLVWKEDPHNIVVRLIRDLGFFCGTLYILFLINPLRYFLDLRILSQSKEFIGVLVGYLSIFIHSLGEIFYLTSITIFYSIFILVYINYLTVKTRKEVRP